MIKQIKKRKLEGENSSICFSTAFAWCSGKCLEKKSLMNNESNTRNPPQVLQLNLISIDFSFDV